MKANEDKTICTNICRPSKTKIVNIKINNLVRTKLFIIFFFKAVVMLFYPPTTLVFLLLSDIQAWVGSNYCRTKR